ncbi:glutamate--cysteine ligase 2 [Nocardia altamirensis]|uniref:glutamate--cysteine ligase 2 n=1 Tax=Nocardia altamirensis TaxID=472158 RepID=UPI0008400276|nr:glutamate--cysteine ligase [Nocardia altamirensis]
MQADSATVGVEEEFILTDPETGAPVPKNVEVARTAAELGIDLQLELTRCQVETSTGVHTDSAALAAELRDLRCRIAGCAEKNGVQLLAAAIPPTVPDQFPVTDTPRYQRIAAAYGMLAHEQGLCGCHVHVAVPDRETAVLVGNYLRPWLPLFLALTANSAIYRGVDTGYASWRSVLWRRWPSAGPPPYFGSLAEYQAMVEMMQSSGSILDKKMVYWDVRPSMAFPTVEVRVSDVPATIEETVLLATLVRATVMTARTSLARNIAPPSVGTEVLHAAYWKAARSGLNGDAVDPVRGRIVPVTDLLTELVDYVGPALDELGDRRLVTDSLATTLARGNGAMRQLNTFRVRREAVDVVAELAAATLEGC